MDDSSTPEVATRLAPPDAPAIDPAPTENPPGFAPLKLLLQPGGLCVELARPDMIVGRHSSADIRLCLPDISRRHCRYLYRDGGWKVVDLGSLNGTFVNGRRLAEAVLVHGDIVRIGSLNFFVDLGRGTPTVALGSHDDDAAPEGVLRSIVQVLPDRRKAS